MHRRTISVTLPVHLRDYFSHLSSFETQRYTDRHTLKPSILDCPGQGCRPRDSCDCKNCGRYDCANCWWVHGEVKCSNCTQKDCSGCGHSDTVDNCDYSTCRLTTDNVQFTVVPKQIGTNSHQEVATPNQPGSHFTFLGNGNYQITYTFLIHPNLRGTILNYQISIVIHTTGRSNFQSSYVKGSSVDAIHGDRVTQTRTIRNIRKGDVVSIQVDYIGAGKETVTPAIDGGGYLEIVKV